MSISAELLFCINCITVWFFFFWGVFLYLLHKLSVVVCVLPLGATPLLDLIVGLTLAKMCHWDQSALKTKLCLNNG